VVPLSAWTNASSEAFIAAAAPPTGAGANTGLAAVPNSVAPRMVELPSASMSRFIAWTRNRPSSVSAIEPESSTMAWMFVAGVHGAAAAPAWPATIVGTTRVVETSPTVTSAAVRVIGRMAIPWRG